MYLYQLMLKKQWLMLEEDEASSPSYYQPKPTRIKHFYDCGYDDIVKQLVNQPQSCKDFYPVLQQVGLPYQSYYDKIADKVSNTLKTALHQEHVVLVQLPMINGYSGTPSYSHDIKPIPIVKKEPTFEPDDSWLVVELLNHKPELIQILDASNNHQVTTAQTSPNQIFLKHGDVFSPSKLLPKVHIVLGGLGGSYDLALRGDKPLRVKQLAQSWLDELSTLLASGNSPFTIELDEAMASLINQKALPQRGLQAKYIDEHNAFRPDETVGVFFYHMLALLNHTNFITARQRIGTCGADESEGAIPDVKSLKQALKSLHNIRHSDGQDKPDYAYHNDTLSKTANHYLSSPLVLDGTGGDNDALSALMTQVKQATEQDRLTDIESLYANAIKLLKHLREPGIIRHVETRREYQLKATQLSYRYIELKPTEGFYIEFHKDHKYEIKSMQLDYAFVGRFNHNNQSDIKIPYKWAHIDDWQLETTVIDTHFIEEYFGDLDLHKISNANSGAAIGSTFGPIGTIVGGVSGYLYGDEIKSNYIEYENQILGGAQVLGGFLTLAVAGSIEIGTGGLGTAVALSLGFIGSDSIAAGFSRMAMDKEVKTIGEDAIAWSGLVPKGYEGITYALVDLTLGSKTMFLSKVPSVTRNIVSIRYMTPAGKKPSLIKDIKVYIDKLSKNTKKQRHIINYKKYEFVTKEIYSILKTEPNSAFFWSGKTENIGGAVVAEQIAKSKSGTTLELLIKKKNVNIPEWNLNDPLSIRAWEEVSEVYAIQVSGEVKAVVGTHLRPGNIWENIELPRLKNNENVTQITTIDPKTKIEKIVFVRGKE